MCSTAVGSSGWALHRSARHLVIVLVISAASVGMDRSWALASEPADSQGPETSGLDCRWSPGDGRGELEQSYDDGSRIVIRLQDGFRGYTGGLVIGAHGRSGFELLDPAHDAFPSLNIWCAQDESLLDRGSGEELAFGWSENFGTGYDGRRLRYLGGTVLEHTDERLILASRNLAEPYQVEKLLLWKAGARHVVIETRVKNVGREPVHFDYWVGEDPWIGTYRTSEGDVAWSSEGLIPFETSIDPKRFLYGGFYDLGNSAANEKAGAFSGAANFIRLSPESPMPDRVLVANRFAHDESEIDPGTPLNNTSLSALNLGWIGIELQPGEAFTLVYAMGVATTGPLTSDPDAAPILPRPPEILLPEWTFGSAFQVWAPDPLQTTASRRPAARSGSTGDLVAGVGEPASGPGLPFRFFKEKVFIDLDDGEIAVHGEYYFKNLRDGPARSTVSYPFVVSDTMPFPHHIEVVGKPHVISDRAIHWLMELESPGEVQKVDVLYRQRLLEPRAAYIVTTTGAWRQPLDLAEFEISYPAEWPGLNMSFPMIQLPERDGRKRLRFVRRGFLPAHEMLFSWNQEVRQGGTVSKIE